jgi:hypothetical protein
MLDCTVTKNARHDQTVAAANYRFANRYGIEMGRVDNSPEIVRNVAVLAVQPVDGFNASILFSRRWAVFAQNIIGFADTATERANVYASWYNGWADHDPNGAQEAIRDAIGVIGTMPRAIRDKPITAMAKFISQAVAQQVTNVPELSDRIVSAVAILEAMTGISCDYTRPSFMVDGTPVDVASFVTSKDQPNVDVIIDAAGRPASTSMRYLVRRAAYQSRATKGLG